MQWRENKRFCLILPLVLNVEGGYVWNKKDKGGATNHGIAYNYHAGRLKAYGIHRPQDMVLLTKEQAIDFYYRYFWVPSQADEIPDTKLALVYFDMAVNSGIEAADKLLRKLPVQNFWHIEGDGKNAAYWWPLTMYFLGLRMQAYTSYKQWPDFGRGWSNRLAIISQDYWKIRSDLP
jgi:lysozyme family protein